MFVAEGIRAVEELLRSPVPIVGAIAAPHLADNLRGLALRTALLERGIELADVDEREFATAADTDSPQGILAIARVPYYSLDALTPVPNTARYLVLDAIQDPGNVGTILRTAAALAATATLALPGTVDLWNAKVVRSAMGAHFDHPALHCTWEDLTLFLGRGGIALWGAELRGTPVSREGTPARLAIAVGNEGAGLSPAVRAAADRLVSLPLPGDVESLNVAVAAGILMYELRP